jgi:hypothetical protein
MYRGGYFLDRFGCEAEGAEFGDSDLLSTGVIANSDDRGSGALEFCLGLVA